MPRKVEDNTTAKIFKKLAKKYGVEIEVEPKFGYVMKMVDKNGNNKYCRSITFPLNNVGAAAVARDKGYAAYFLKKLGYRVPRGKTFYSDSWARVVGSKDTAGEGLKCAEKIGWPVIVKPNDGSRGEKVCLCANKQEYLQAAKEITKKFDVFLVQEYLHGNDFRLLVLDGEVVAAYQRKPLQIIGDGKKTIKELIASKEKLMRQMGIGGNINWKDFRIFNALKNRKLKSDVVPPAGEEISLLPNANLSTGGVGIDFTGVVNSKWRELAVKIAKDMDLIFCGIDIITDGPLEDEPKDFVVLEINAVPGFSNFSRIGEKQAELVEKIYEKIFLKIINF